jgi:hypothetical protein
MRTAKPYWKTSHKCYYLRLDGKDIRLDPDETKAQDQYFKIMASRTSELKDHDLTSENATVRQLLVAFLEWSEANDKPRTFQYYQGYLTGPRGFAAYVSPQLRISDLRNFHVTGYLRKFHAAHQTGSIVPALKRPFNWAVKEGYIQYNPIQGVKRPPTIGRAGDDDVYIAPPQYDALLAPSRPLNFAITSISCIRQDAAQKKSTSCELNGSRRISAVASSRPLRSKEINLDGNQRNASFASMRAL